MNEELKNKLIQIEPSATIEDSGEWLNVHYEKEHWKKAAQLLRHTIGLEMDYMFCVTCIDWKIHLTMVYHFTSTIHRHTIVAKVKLDRLNPTIDTVSDIWRTAEFHEREAYDLFGVVFTGHPDLRRIFLTEEWVGWPLRKDYEDPINMIKL